MLIPMVFAWAEQPCDPIGVGRVGPRSKKRLAVPKPEPKSTWTPRSDRRAAGRAEDAAPATVKPVL